MSVRTGQVDTSNQLVGIKQDMDEGIRILDPHDVPLQQWLPTDSTRSIKVEWLEEDLVPQTVTVAAGGVAGTGPFTLTLESGDASVLRVGDVLHVVDADSGVQFLVTAVDEGADTADVADFAGNTTDPAAADVLEIIGQYRNEGSDPEEARSIDRRDNHNFTQWGQERVEATRTARKQDRFANSDPLEHDKMKNFKNLGIRFERSLVHGQRIESGDKKKRFMGGFFYFISTNAVSGTKSQIKANVGSLMRKVYERGGSAHTLWVSPAIKEALDDIDGSLRRTSRAENTVGSVVDEFVTSFGTVQVKVNRHFPKTKALLLDRQDLARVNFDPYFYEELAQTGDRKHGHIVGEFTLRVKNEQGHGILTVTDAT